MDDNTHHLAQRGFQTGAFFDLGRDFFQGFNISDAERNSAEFRGAVKARPPAAGAQAALQLCPQLGEGNQILVSSDVLAAWFRSKGFGELSGFDAPGWLVKNPNTSGLGANDIHLFGHFFFPFRGASNLAMVHIQPSNSNFTSP